MTSFLSSDTVYDFISYPFSIYSSTIVDIITGGASDLKTVFQWNIIINSCYVPGTLGGALMVNRVEPKRLMIIMLLLRAIFSFVTSGAYGQLQKHIAGFTVMQPPFCNERPEL